MPPDSAISDNDSNNNLSNISNILSQDEIDYLLSHFEAHHKSLRCPNCEKKGIFRCTGYGSSFRAKTTLNIVNSTQSTPANTQTSMNPEFSESFQGAMSSQVTQTNTSARAEIERLRAQTAPLQEQLNQQNATSNTTNPLNPSDFPPLRNTTTPLLQSTPWHQSERLQQIKDQLTAQQQRLQRQEAAAHLLQTPSTNQGFKYIYLPTKARDNVDFIDEERTNLAFMHHCNRMERALRFIRVPVKFAVARHFFNKGWISKQTLEDTLSSNRRASHAEADLLFFEDEHMNAMNDCNNTQSNFMESHMEDDPSL
ncbi:hypothetical protein G6F42_000563 [Rhizopus arrhizus]|nr:hypothetical protein G6F42_000563 [Rhizopus arrhizus]